MPNNLLSYYFLVLLVSGLLSNANAQDWVEIGYDEKQLLLSKLKSQNSEEGCHEISYTVYNHTITSTPTEKSRGRQCKSGNASVVNVFGQYLMYSDDSVVIQIDSSAKIITVSHNLAQMDIDDRGEDAYSALIENNDLIFKKKDKSIYEGIKIISIENNEIAHYVLLFNNEYQISRFEIHYDETKDMRYNRPADINQPIMVIEFNAASTSILSKMLSADYFLENLSQPVRASKKYALYKVDDARILSNK